MKQHTQPTFGIKVLFMNKIPFVILFICLFVFKSVVGQVNYIRQFSNGADQLKSTGLFKSNKSQELVMAISNYTKNSSSIILIDRNGKQKYLGSFSLSQPYHYIADLHFFNDTIYGCGNSNSVKAEEGCTGAKAKGFYFKCVLNRSNEGAITGTFSWIKEDVLSSGQGSYYTKIIRKDATTLFLAGTSYASGYTGCSGQGMGAISMVRESDGFKQSTKRFISDFTAITDMNYSNDELFVHMWDWRLNTTGFSYMTLLKLNSSTLAVKDSGHYRAFDMLGNLLPGNVQLPKSLISDGNTFVTASGFGTDPHNVDKGFAVYRIDKTNMKVVKQINIKVDNATYLSFGQLVKNNNDFVLMYANRQTTSSVYPDVVGLIRLDSNFNVITSYDFTTNLYNGHSMSSNANTLLVQDYDLFLFTNVSGKVNLNRLDIDKTSNSCVALTQKVSSVLSKPCSTEVYSFPSDAFHLSTTNGSTGTNTFNSTVSCLYCKLKLKVSFNSIDAGKDSATLYAFVDPAIGNYKMEWIDESNGTVVHAGSYLRVLKSKNYKFKVRELDFTNCADSFSTKDAVVEISKVEKPNAISIYPNPVQDYMYHVTNEDVKYVVFSIDGLKQTGLKYDQADGLNKLNVRDLSKGMYLLQIEGQQGKDKQYVRFIKE